MSKTKKILIAFVLLFATGFLAASAAVLAQAPPPPTPPAQKSGVENLQGSLQTFGGVTGLGGADADLKTRIARIINIVLGFLGVMAVIMIIISGFQWMMAGGNEQSVTDAKSRLKNAIIGLAIVLAAYVIVGFTVKALTHSIQDAPPSGPPGGGGVPTRP